MNLGIFLVNHTFSNLFDISLRHSFYVFNFFNEAGSHHTYKFVLFFEALIEDITLLLLNLPLDESFDQIPLLYSVVTENLSFILSYLVVFLCKLADSSLLMMHHSACQMIGKDRSYIILV